MKRFLLCILLACLEGRANVVEFFTIGPMIHLNFGGGKKDFSIGLEAAYWHFRLSGDNPLTYANRNKIGKGIDLGIEMDVNSEIKKFRIYIEPQIGNVHDYPIGLALGPVLEINPVNNFPHLGIQGSTWFSPGIGTDFRVRYIDAHTFISPGVFLKKPYTICDDCE